MAAELSNILEHIERIGELDLDGVAAHVARGRRRERPARRRAAAVAAARGGAGRGARDAGRRLPRAEPAGVSELIDLTAAQAAERVAPGDQRGRAVRRLPRARRRRRAQRLPLGRRGGAASATPTAPLAGVPLAVKDLFCTEGVPSQAGSRILEGYRPPYTATVVERLAERRRAAARQDQPGRVRDGLVERELRLTARCSTRGTARACRAARAAAAPPPSPRASRRGRSAPTPAARSASPPRCAGSSASSPPTARSAATG